MNIIVCIKQVPDTNEVKIDRETNTLIRQGVPSIINPFDENAIEAGLSLRDATNGKLTIISMGPAQVETALKDAIAMGADEAILLSDRAFAGADTWATSYVLSKAIEKIADFDLIICGKQATDGDTAQVGPGIAEFLNLPLLTYIKKIEVQDNKSLIVEREFEDGYELIKAPLPCVLTVNKELNTPRMPSLKGKMKAKTINIPMWTAQDLNADLDLCGLKGSPTKVVKIFNPPIKTDQEKITGSPEEIVKEILDKLKSRKII